MHATVGLLGSDRCRGALGEVGYRARGRRSTTYIDAQGPRRLLSVAGAVAEATATRAAVAAVQARAEALQDELRGALQSQQRGEAQAVVLSQEAAEARLEAAATAHCLTVEVEEVTEARDAAMATARLAEETAAQAEAEATRRISHLAEQVAVERRAVAEAVDELGGARVLDEEATRAREEVAARVELLEQVAIPPIATHSVSIHAALSLMHSLSCPLCL